MAAKDPRAHKTRRPARRRAGRMKRRSAPAAGGRGRPAAATNRQSLLRLCSWFLPDDAIFAGLQRHGNTRWRPRGLVWLALCWSLVDARHLTDAFDQARAA